MRTPEQIRAHSRQQYYADPQKWKRRVKDWQLRNAEKVRAYKKKYAHSEEGKEAARKHSERTRKKYPGRVKGSFRKWYDSKRAKNPRQVIEFKKTEEYRRIRLVKKRQNKRRWKIYARARKAGAAGRYTQKQWMARVEYYGWSCWMCRCTLSKMTLTQDHVIPLSRGGTNWPSNLRPACKPCNSRKNDRLIGIKRAIDEAG